MKKLSIVIPCYNEEESIEIFLTETQKVEKQLPEYEFEYIFVNDGSKDKTLEVLRKVSDILTFTTFHSHVTSEKKQHY